MTTVEKTVLGQSEALSGLPGYQVTGLGMEKGSMQWVHCQDVQVAPTLPIRLGRKEPADFIMAVRAGCETSTGSGGYRAPIREAHGAPGPHRRRPETRV